MGSALVHREEREKSEPKPGIDQNVASEEEKAAYQHLLDYCLEAESLQNASLLLDALDNKGDRSDVMERIDDACAGDARGGRLFTLEGRGP